MFSTAPDIPTARNSSLLDRGIGSSNRARRLSSHKMASRRGRLSPSRHSTVSRMAVTATAAISPSSSLLRRQTARPASQIRS